MKKNEHVTRRNGITELTEQGVDDLLEHIEEDMDQSFMRSGKTLAELFRSVCIAALKLPNLELHTELMCVINDENSLTVIFHRDEAEAKSDENAGRFWGHERLFPTMTTMMKKRRNGFMTEINKAADGQQQKALNHRNSPRSIQGYEPCFLRAADHAGSSASPRIPRTKCDSGSGDRECIRLGGDRREAEGGGCGYGCGNLEDPGYWQGGTAGEG